MLNKIAIVGGGPAGLMCALIAKRTNPYLEITIFEKKDIGATLLPTGGGRCNLTYNDLDIKSFAANYPRGEKFLYSVFNQFFIEETIDFFASIGIKTYIQPDNRIFPISNKSLDVIFALKNEIKKLGIKVVGEEINNIQMKEGKFIVSNKIFDKLVISTGGKKSLILNSLLKFGHNIIEQKPALCGLEIEEKFFQNISGVTLKNVLATAKLNNKIKILNEDLLFTHKGISGPLAYKISSLFSRENFDKTNPINVFLDFTNQMQFDLQELLDKNSKKEIQSLLNEFIPKSMTKLLLTQNNIPVDKKCHQIVKNERELIKKLLTNLKITVLSPIKEGEIVSSGGIDLKEINPKTMESKIVKNLFFCGEVIDVDGFCGGYNLQNCWSTGYVAGFNLHEI